METRVVNLRTEAYDVYIGRANSRKGLRGSVWANPYRIGRDGSREDVIAKYRSWLLEQPELMVRLPELRGKTLGCWCKPEACHGDVIAELIEEEAASNGK